MKIITKLRLGTGTLFLFISLLLSLSMVFIYSISKDTKNILAANYNTLDYSKHMLMNLDDAPTNSIALKNFRENLIKQKNNITEKGEKEVTAQLEINFNNYLKHPADKVIISSIRQDIYQLMDLNMTAIKVKSNTAQKTADNAYTWISFIGAFCFLISFSLLINFPNSIANPIRILTDSIKEIANKNYSLWLNLESNDEFGDMADAFNTMAAKLKEYEQSSISQILFEKKRIETLINKMHDPVIGLNEHQNVVFANEEALHLLSLKAEDVIGKTTSEISSKNDLMRALTKDISPIKSNEKKTRQEPLKIYTNNKESYFNEEIVDINFIPTGEKVSKQIGHVIILKNITAYKELDVLKTNFISTVSHELKTPISSILISLKLLSDERIGQVNEEQKQFIKNIKEDTERLLKMTGELLNMTQAETGMIQLNRTTASPREIIQLATDANKIQAEQKNIQMEVNYLGAVPSIHADTEKTAWVLTNFISNAIRYSHQDDKIIITAYKQDNDVYFSVQDFGKGIDEKYKDKIFDRYFRIPGNDKEGTGLGLAISKEFIEAQNGSIGMSSEVNKGSVFYFKLSVV
ncbi:MAG: ATP-binding protein [Chitinophagales bacterium]